MTTATYKVTGGPRLTEGQIVFNQGYEFIATNVRYYDEGEEGYENMHYVGVCTDDARNESIRHTGYNGGTYGYRVCKEP